MVRRKLVRHFHEPGHLHELTFSCYRRRPLLTNDDWRGWLARSLETAGKEEGFQLVGFVFMPEHVHLLTYPLDEKPNFAGYLARIKQPFSKQIKERLLIENQSRLLQELTIRERPGKHCFRFWQEGPGYDRNVFSPTAVETSIRYIHENPVRPELCLQTVDWRWSSARYYLLDPPRQQFPELPFIHGPPPGMLD